MCGTWTDYTSFLGSTCRVKDPVHPWELFLLKRALSTCCVLSAAVTAMWDADSAFKEV